MTMDRRLGRAMSALTGREAAVLALRNYKDGKLPDASLCLHLRGSHLTEYNRLVRIMNFVNGELADILLIVREQVTQQELRLLLLQEIVEHAADIELPLPFEEHVVVPDDIARHDTVNFIRLLGMATGCGLSSCWVQLQAVAVVAGEYAVEFDGEDPFRPNLREYLDDALTRIEMTGDLYSRYVSGWALPQDLEDALALTRQVAERVLG